MERLTFDGNFCDIGQCRELPCPYNGACSQRKVWERLKAYEDTGLTPEAFQSYAVFLQDLIGNQKASEALDRFRRKNDFLNPRGSGEGAGGDEG